MDMLMDIEIQNNIRDSRKFSRNLSKIPPGHQWMGPAGVPDPPSLMLRVALQKVRGRHFPFTKGRLLRNPTSQHFENFLLAWGATKVF